MRQTVRTVVDAGKMILAVQAKENFGRLHDVM